ncbi:hypothetical protein DSLPV1_019 [Dishui lake phycodnavirus 1]|uniref:hypothetical protein n=1 Tax=Dishui lake phycodnavirus 1 TaxID=2079134 RepID=UPI000CD693D2|nr:hypothetical protein C5Y57_gp019 [Dishui lake phycodnavirus 1]AUT18990.1 hypothetical protein DSLPV1_019 [Dishui lake phycodnavirus 1]
MSEFEQVDNRLDHKIWHQQQEAILKAWGEASACYRYIHFQAFLAYKKKYMRATLPVIVLSTLTGTANFAMSDVPDNLKQIAQQSIGAANLIAGLIATISTFLKLSENTEAHKNAAYTFGKFSRKIRLELALPLKDRTKDGAIMIEECKAEYDRMLEQQPDIPKAILEDFDRTFPGSSLYKPEIIQIHPIRTFPAIQENAVLKKLRNLADGNSREKRKLMKELDAIRKSGEGLVTAPKSTTILKRSIFSRHKEKDPDPLTPINSDDEYDDDELSEVITEEERTSDETAD